MNTLKGLNITLPSRSRQPKAFTVCSSVVCKLHTEFKRADRTGRLHYIELRVGEHCQMLCLSVKLHVAIARSLHFHFYETSVISHNIFKGGNILLHFCFFIWLREGEIIQIEMVIIFSSHWRLYNFYTWNIVVVCNLKICQTFSNYRYLHSV